MAKTTPSPCCETYSSLPCAAKLAKGQPAAAARAAASASNLIKPPSLESRSLRLQKEVEGLNSRRGTGQYRRIAASTEVAPRSFTARKTSDIFQCAD